MTEFKEGDRVRLKLKPEVEGVVVGPELWHPNKVRFDAYPFDGDGRYDVYNRWPEEIELVPRPIQVGDEVKHSAYDNGLGRVLAEVEHKGVKYLVVGWLDYLHPSLYPPRDLKLVP